MSYGIQVTKGGLQTLNNTMIGGRVYVDLIYKETETSGTVTNYDYPAIPDASKVRIHQIGGGTHTYTVSNHSGGVRISLTAISSPSFYSVPFTLLLVFSTETVESGYGILTKNEDGETVVSALYPVPEFIGKLTPGAAYNSYDLGSEGFYLYNHQATSSIGAGRERFILWAPAQTNENVWFNGQSHISASVTGTFDLQLQVATTPGTPYYIPEAYVFALNSHSPSSEAFGIQVRDAAGQVTFDSGLNHMVMKALTNNVSYPASTGTINSYTVANLTDVNWPAGSFPQYYREVIATTVQGFTGFIRMRAAFTDTRLIRTVPPSSAGGRPNGTYEYGLRENLTQAIINTADYASTSYSLTGRTWQFDGTSACSYDASLGQTTCSSYSYHTVRYRGGYGSNVTFSWSLLSNTGGLSISGSTTSVDVTVVKTGGQGTFSATLRCTISDGITSVNIDRNISHVHTEVYTGGGGDGGGGGDSGGGDGGGGCFITTATVDHLGHSDDGEILTALRMFRDTFMRSSPDFQKDVEWYYTHAPAIVEAINKLPNAREIYAEMYEKFILPSVQLIKDEKHVQAYSVYREGVKWSNEKSGLNLTLPEAK